MKTTRGEACQLLLTKKRKHKNQCNLERQEMDCLHSRSRTHPEDWTCICTNWSNPHFMPHSNRQPKGWMTKRRLKYHVFGIANTGTGEVILLPHFEFWVHDANLHVCFSFLLLYAWC